MRGERGLLPAHQRQASKTPALDSRNHDERPVCSSLPARRAEESRSEALRRRGSRLLAPGEERTRCLDGPLVSVGPGVEGARGMRPLRLVEAATWTAV